MDYDKFKKEWDKYQKDEKILRFSELDGVHTNNDDWLDFRAYNCVDRAKEDRVNSPSHYTRGSQEVIVTIEEAIQDAPSVKDGMLQAQVLKYMLRLWLKDNPAEDAKKAEWYLKRLIDSLNS